MRRHAVGALACFIRASAETCTLQLASCSGSRSAACSSVPTLAAALRATFVTQASSSGRAACSGPQVLTWQSIKAGASNLGLRQGQHSQMQLWRSFCAQQPEKRSGGFASGGAPMSLKALIVALMAGAGVLAGTNAYKDSKLKQVSQTSQQVVGKASVGGPFQLIDHDGKPFSDKDLLGEFALLYFGFTFCPDICPDELEKVGQVVDLIDKQAGVKVQPVFISVDPERDTPPKVKEYVREFHPRMIGLTGDMDSVKRASKQYRVYFSKTGDGDGEDYLVDHSIIHYLINPAGEFVTFYAKSYTAEQMAQSVIEHMAKWQEEHPEYQKGRQLATAAAPAAAGPA